MKIVSRALIGLCFAVILVESSAAQSTAGKPADWILYERANAMAAQHEYGQALQLYKEAISSAGIFPEAEIGIGDVFFEEGEFTLAKDEYEKAYNLRNAFKITETQYEVLYKLASLYEAREMYKQMEDSLLKIVADDKRLSGASGERLRKQIDINYRDKGLDRTLFLYQFNVPFAADAHSKLGWFYYRSGRYDQAMHELLYAVIYRASEINASLREADIDYQFSTLADMLSAVGRDKALSAFVSSGGLIKDLYYLAGSSYQTYPAHAVLIWKLISGTKLSGKYASLAARQLKAPWTEKLLGADR